MRIITTLIVLIAVLDGSPLAVAKSSDWENARIIKADSVGPKLKLWPFQSQEEVP